MHNIKHLQNQQDISPWQFPQDNIQICKNIAKDNILTKFTQNADIYKETRLKKFNKTIQQHRQRLSKRYQRTNFKGRWIDHKNKSLNFQMNRNLNIIDNRSQVANKFISQTIDLKEIKPKINKIYQFQREIIKSFYRPKSTTQNADKYYGNINKNNQLSRCKIETQAVQIRPTTPILITINKKKIASKSASIIRQFKSILTVKQANYSSSKSVKNIRCSSENIKKKNNMNKVQIHALDLILSKI